MPRGRPGTPLLVLAVALVATAMGAGPAWATPVSGNVTAATDAGLPHTTPSSRFSSDRGTINLSGTRSFANVTAVDRGAGVFHVHLTAPEGRDLAVGVYDHAVGFPGHGSGAPGISVGDGCGEKSGRFEILDIAWDAKGEPTRLWAVYEALCPYPTSTLFGEIRVGMPARPVLGTAPTLVRWPEVDPQGSGAVVPVAVDVTQPLDISSVSVAGPDARTMAVRLDECTGRTVMPEVGCQVFVRFAPTMGGTRTAVLRVRSADGRSADVRLQGHAHGGRTRLVVRGEPGEQVTGGRSLAFLPAGASFALEGVRQAVRFRVGGAGGWIGGFDAGAGDILGPGRYLDPGNRYPEVTPGVDVGGPSGSCRDGIGSFTVTEATFAPSGRVRTFGADFEQRCAATAPALRGTFEYRVGDTVPPAPWRLAAGVAGPPTPLVPASGPDTPAWPVEDPAPQPEPPARPGTPVAPVTATPAPPAPPASRPPAGSRPPAPVEGFPPSPAPPSPPAPTPPASAPATAPQATPPGKAAAPCAGPAWRQLTRRGDRFTGGPAAEWIRGGGGADLLRMGAGADCADGGAGNDRLEGGTGSDVLTGGTGADVLLGGSGDDTLDGGPGRDRLDCGTGRHDVARAGPGDRVRRCERVMRTTVR